MGATHTYVLMVLLGRQTDSRSSSRGCTDWIVFTFQGARHGEPFTHKGGIKIHEIYQFKKIIFYSSSQTKVAVNKHFTLFTATLV